MSNTSSIFAVFSVLVGVMLFGIWSNIHAYAQQSSSPTLSASSPPTGDSLSTTTISPELKAKICDPSNPSLKVVNTTESHICGIPKTIKPPSLSASPPISTVSSSTQKTTIKPTPAASVAAPKQQQQQIATTNNNSTIIPASQLPKQTGNTAGGKGTTTAANIPLVLRPLSGGACPSGYHLVSGVTCIKDVTSTRTRKTTTVPPPTAAPVRNVSNKSLSSPPTIAPQVSAINKQQQQQLLTVSNGTAGQNYTFASSSPVVASDKLMYLGYHGSSSTSDSSSSKDKQFSYQIA
jgi:hypothetical protein